MRRFWLRLRRFLAQRVLHTDDSAHRIALGAAIAMFVALLPLVGLQTILAIAVAALFRANKAVCIPIVWITNPFTIVPIYGSAWGLGRFVMASKNAANEEAMLGRLAALARDMSVLEAGFWSELFAVFGKFGLELWVGCFVLGAAAALASYFLARYGVTQYRERRRRRILARQLFRSNLPRQNLATRTESAA
jgi:hypothetical protein